VNLCAIYTSFNFFSLDRQNLNSKSQNLWSGSGQKPDRGQKSVRSKISQTPDRIRPDRISGRLLPLSNPNIPLRYPQVALSNRNTLKCIQYTPLGFTKTIADAIDEFLAVTSKDVRVINFQSFVLVPLDALQLLTISNDTGIKLFGASYSPVLVLWQ
jgi:hypothetical protein